MSPKGYQPCRVPLSHAFQDQDAAGATALHLAARFGQVAVVQWLLSVGAGAQDQTDCGAIPAHYATARGDLTCLKLLIQLKPGYDYHTGLSLLSQLGYQFYR